MMSKRVVAAFLVITLSGVFSVAAQVGEIHTTPSPLADWWVNPGGDLTIDHSYNVHLRGEFVGYFRVDLEEIIDTQQGPGELLHDSRLMVGTFESVDGGSIPAAGALISKGQSNGRLLPIAANVDPYLVDVIVSAYMATVTGVGEVIDPTEAYLRGDHNEIGGGEECTDVCDAAEIKDLAVCGGALALCAVAAAAVYQVCASGCLLAVPVIPQCEIGCLANLAIAEALCLGGFSLCAIKADNNHDQCVDNCCLLQGDPMQTTPAPLN